MSTLVSILESIRSQWRQLLEDRALLTVAVIGLIVTVGQLVDPLVQRGLLFTATWGLVSIGLLWEERLGRGIDLAIWLLAALWLAADCYELFDVRRLPEDFETNDLAARRVYGKGLSPYGLESALGTLNFSLSFPFPTYWLMWACSAFGRLSPHEAFGVFRVVMFVMYALSWMAIWRWLKGLHPPCPFSARAGGLVALLALSGWAWVSIVMGQTTVAVLFCFALWLALSHQPSRWFWMIGNVVMALGVLIKPILAPVWLSGLLQWRHGAYDGERAWGKWTTIGLPACMILIIGSTLVLPGGIGASHYQEWLTEIAPLAKSYAVGSRTNFSPAAWITDTRFEIVREYEVPSSMSWLSYVDTLRSQHDLGISGGNEGLLIPVVLGGVHGNSFRVGLGRMAKDPDRWWWTMAWGVWSLGVFWCAWRWRVDPAGWGVASVLSSPLVWGHYLLWFLPLQALSFALSHADVVRQRTWCVQLAVLSAWTPPFMQIGLMWMGFTLFKQSSERSVKMGKYAVRMAMAAFLMIWLGGCASEQEAKIKALETQQTQLLSELTQTEVERDEAQRERVALVQKQEQMLREAEVFREENRKILQEIKALYENAIRDLTGMRHRFDALREERDQLQATVAGLEDEIKKLGSPPDHASLDTASISPKNQGTPSGLVPGRKGPLDVVPESSSNAPNTPSYSQVETDALALLNRSTLLDLMRYGFNRSEAERVASRIPFRAWDDFLTSNVGLDETERYRLKEMLVKQVEDGSVGLKR